jgi:hypothetical protein
MKALLLLHVELLLLLLLLLLACGHALCTTCMAHIHTPS